MFKKVLIANRGEIACRVAATCRRLGVATVAIYSDVDKYAKHVQMCDEAVALGGNSAKESYLRWERILEIAQQTGAQAIHPGYGFLSENEAFAKACEQLGLVFIGPPSQAILAMGLKAQSKQLMEKAGVPLVPGYHGSEQSSTFLQQQADSIGYPVLIKASAGGGGKGMRIVQSKEDFLEALASCQREAQNSFGNDAVLIEKYVQRPRHIEIQIFADKQGNCIYLFERDCSVQRRHQKVLEEAPAPGMSEAMRERMGQAAVAAAKAVNYEGAGTVEFIVEQRDDGSMAFYFMEMNTRLQVEHPVTEAITGLDLVQWQLKVASGEPLPLKQCELSIQGHAIEARICAETPNNHFLPSVGQLHVYRQPVCVSFINSDKNSLKVRIDDGVREGDSISPFYDSMIAKLIVHAPTRQEALVKLDHALAQFHIVGVANNVQFLRNVIKTDSFSSAVLDTALIEREAQHVFIQTPLALSLGAAAYMAFHLYQGQQVQMLSPRGGCNPFNQNDAWNSHGTRTRSLDFALVHYVNNTTEYLNYTVVLIISRDENLQHKMHLSVKDAQGVAVCHPLPFTWRVLPVGSQTYNTDRLDVELGEQRLRFAAYKNQETVTIFSMDGAVQLQTLDKVAHAHDAHNEHGGRLTAPMPGKVLNFFVEKGSKVAKGQPLAVMEAMKMEHTINAPNDGTVKELLFNVGSQVSEGDILLSLEE